VLLVSPVVYPRALTVACHALFRRPPRKSPHRELNKRAKARLSRCGSVWAMPVSHGRPASSSARWGSLREFSVSRYVMGGFRQTRLGARVTFRARGQEASSVSDQRGGLPLRESGIGWQAQRPGVNTGLHRPALGRGCRAHRERRRSWPLPSSHPSDRDRSGRAYSRRASEELEGSVSALSCVLAPRLEALTAGKKGTNLVFPARAGGYLARPDTAWNRQSWWLTG